MALQVCNRANMNYITKDKTKDDVKVDEKATMKVFLIPI